MLDYRPAEMAEWVALARRIKSGDAQAARDALRDRILTTVFFNPSLRTRASFDAAMLRHGGHTICLNVGGDSWKLEHRDGVVMDGDRSEHIKEAAPVLSRYGDALAVRSFALLRSAEEDERDEILRGFSRYATVPVINMESAMEHPCQGLADWMTMAEQLGDLQGKRFVLSWAPHVKALPMAVPHSAVLAAAAAGMRVTIAHPPSYELHPGIVDRASSWCAQAGSSLEVVSDQESATREADALYVKSWGAHGMYDDADAQHASFAAHAGWRISPAHLGPRTRVMHCLPVRRNVVISDAVLDSPQSVVVDQAENRLWAQTAVLTRLLGKEGRFQ
jgi:N-acetylornithine carbamoyltransferase